MRGGVHILHIMSYEMGGGSYYFAYSSYQRGGGSYFFSYMSYCHIVIFDIYTIFYIFCIYCFLLLRVSDNSCPGYELSDDENDGIQPPP